MWGLKSLHLNALRLTPRLTNTNISPYAFAFKTFDLTHLILFHPFHVRRAALELEYAERVQMDGLIYFLYFMLES